MMKASIEHLQGNVLVGFEDDGEEDHQDLTTECDTDSDYSATE